MVHGELHPREHAGGARQGGGLHGVLGSPAGRAATTVPHEHRANVVAVERHDSDQHATNNGKVDSDL